MKSFLTLLTILLPFSAFSQLPGTLDSTFGIGGKVLTSINPGQDKAYSIALRPNGKILVAGYTTNSVTGKDFAVLRYNNNGTLDSSFGFNGIVTTDLQVGSEDVAYSMAVQLDGKIVLAGSSDNGISKDAAIVRYLPDGLIDSSFGTNGVVLTDFENLQPDEVKVVKVHPQTGKIIIGGSTKVANWAEKPVVARYTNSGMIDSTFDSDGIRTLSISFNDFTSRLRVEDLIVHTDGTISAVGWRHAGHYDFWSARVQNNGVMDSSYLTNGSNSFDGGYSKNDYANALLLKPDNSFVIAGGSYRWNSTSVDFTLFELTNSGITNPWSVTLDLETYRNDIAYGLQKDNHGDFVLAGSSSDDTSSLFAIARFKPDPIKDVFFGANGQLLINFNDNSNNEAFDLAIQSDNKIIAVGYSGNDFALVRIVGDGPPKLNDFQLIFPSNGIVGIDLANQNFYWTVAYGATSYEIQIGLDSTLSTAQTYTTSGTVYTLNNPLVSGTKYYWRVRATDGTNWGDYSDIWALTTSQNTGLVPESQFFDLKIYPNPTSDLVTVEGNNKFLNLTYKLTDYTGKEIKSDIIKSEKFELKLAGLPSGNYILQLGDNPLHTYKITKE